MLKTLHVRNYAIIDEIAVDFSSHLNIITGETGAGKSILIGALNLVLGERFESAALFDKEKKCVVEATFEIKDNKSAVTFLQSHELDNDNELTIRREVAPNGKSRAFVNDTPVNLTQLKSLSCMLVDLHQQFDTLELGDYAFQRQVLDALAENGKLLKEYTGIFQQYNTANTELAELKLQQQNANAVLDYNRFLFEELESADLKEDELEKADAELKLLNNVENIKLQLNAICFELNEGEQPLVQQLKVLGNKLKSLTVFHQEIESISVRLQSTVLEVEDIAQETEQLNDAIQYNAERLQFVNDRISLGYKLLKKHNVKTTAELLAIQQSLGERLKDILNIGDAILQKEKLVLQLHSACGEIAALISANRNKSVKPFIKNVNALLAQVGMPNAQIKVAVNRTSLNSFGWDEIEFLFDANLSAGQAGKSNRFEPLRKVASGGELSRLMLCIKSLVAQKLQLPTLIFDEIDTGISGEAAKQVGIIMKTLSRSHQVISITHQPQIAARADVHYYVYKAVNGERINTLIRPLTNDERITAIAKMLSGEKPTLAALENAREMVCN